MMVVIYVDDIGVLYYKIFFRYELTIECISGWKALSYVY